MTYKYNSVSSEDFGLLKFPWKKVQHSESGWYAHDLEVYACGSCFEKNIARVTFALRLKVYLVEYFTFSFHLLITLIDIEIWVSWWFLVSFYTCRVGGMNQDSFPVFDDYTV